MSSFDMERLMQQAAQMQEQMQRMQDEAAQETAQSSVGGGLVKVTANGAGEVVAIEISRDAIDPDDPLTQYNLACGYATLGDIDAAFDLLERSLPRAGPEIRQWIKYDSTFDALRSHPRYHKLVEIIGEA